MDKLSRFVDVLGNAEHVFYILLGIIMLFTGIFLRAKGILRKNDKIEDGMTPIAQSREDIKAGRYSAVFARYTDILVIIGSIFMIIVSLNELFKSSIPDMARALSMTLITLPTSLTVAVWNTCAAYIGYFYEREIIQGTVESHESVNINGAVYLKPVITYKINDEIRRYTEICMYSPKRVPLAGTVTDLIYCEENEKVMTYRELHQVRMWAFYGWSFAIINVLLIIDKFILKIM